MGVQFFDPSDRGLDKLDCADLAGPHELRLGRGVEQQEFGIRVRHSSDRYSSRQHLRGTEADVKA
jgi:hypothetical protein